MSLQVGKINIDRYHAPTFSDFSEKICIFFHVGTLRDQYDARYRKFSLPQPNYLYPNDILWVWQTYIVVSMFVYNPVHA